MDWLLHALCNTRSFNRVCLAIQCLDRGLPKTDQQYQSSKDRQSRQTIASPPVTMLILSTISQLVSRWASLQPARQLGSSRPGNRWPPAGQPGAPHFNLKCCTFQFEVNCGGVFGDRIFTVPKHTPTTGVQIEKCTVSIWKCGAAGSPAGGQRLPGRLLASCLAGWLAAVWLISWRAGC